MRRWRSPREAVGRLALLLDRRRARLFTLSIEDWMNTVAMAMSTFLVKTWTEWLVVSLNASTIARPRLPVPPATAMMAMVGDGRRLFEVF